MNPCPRTKSWANIPAFEREIPIQYPYKFKSSNTTISFHIDNDNELLFAGNSGPFLLQGLLIIGQKPCKIDLNLQITSGYNPLTKLFLEEFANQAGIDILALFS
jgi:hypothetical protein